MKKSPLPISEPERIFAALRRAKRSKLLLLSCFALMPIAGLAVLLLSSRANGWPALSAAIAFFLGLAGVKLGIWLNDRAEEQLEFLSPLDALGDLLQALETQPPNTESAEAFERAVAEIIGDLTPEYYFILDGGNLERLKAGQGKWNMQIVEALERARTHAEMMPPWVRYPRQDTWWGGWRQGHSEHWMKALWRPFWQRLSKEEQVSYVDRWQAPTEWRELLLTDFLAGESGPGAYVLGRWFYES